MLNPSYRRVGFRATGTPPGHHDVVGMSLDVPQGSAADALRFHLSVEDARRLGMALLDAAAIQCYRAEVELLKSWLQSPISSGNPIDDGSVSEGQSQ